MPEFVHFHCHNEYSLLDGYGTAEQYVAEAKNLKMTSLGCTNHGNVDGCIKFQNACKEGGITPIIGCELYVVKDLVCTEKKEKRYHALAIAKNEIGWTNLLKMLTLANTEGFHYKPRVSPEVMLKHSEGLVVCSACSSSFIRADWGEKLLLGLKERLDKDLYLEVMPHCIKDQCDTNLLAVSLSKKHDISLCASNDCHYPTAVGAEYQEVLLAIQSRTVWSDPKRWKFDINTLYLKNNRQMFKDFISQKCIDKEDVLQAFDGGQEIGSKCKFLIPKLPVNLPKVVGHENEDETELLNTLLKTGFKQRILSHPKRSKSRCVYQARLDEEFKSICELGFQKYFAIVWELINWCKSNDIMVGPGRGSVGGSLLAYLLYITDVDPIEHKLLFSRFISPARIDLPDIDMDFEDRKRHLVRKHLEDSYGKNNIAGLSTFSTMKGRGAIRDVSRVFAVPRKDVDAASKSIVVRSGGDNRCDFTIEDSFETFEDGIAFKKNYPDVARISMALEGQVRGAGQHAAAMCISSEDLREGKRCSIAMRNKVAVANWDKHDAEHVGLMKLDILGLSALTVLSECKDQIKSNHGVDIEYNKLDMEDADTYAEINAGNTVGIFQIGSPGLSRYCRELGVNCFKDVVDATSLWRPGTLRSGMTTIFQQRKAGAKWKSIHPRIDELTKDTYGIVLYQEQVMQFMYDLAGLPWRTCDIIRKVISKSQGNELFQSFRAKFVEGCVSKNTLDEESAGRVWDELSTFGCLTGDTILYRASGNQHSNPQISIEQAYDYQQSDNFKHRGLKILSMDEDGRIRPHSIKKIWRTGEKEVFFLRTDSNKWIRASAEHRFLINNNWMQVKSAKVGDWIRATDRQLPNSCFTAGEGSGPFGKVSPASRKGQGKTNEEIARKKLLLQEYDDKCQICASDKFLELHHKDGDHSNNCAENTMLVCRKCYRRQSPPSSYARFKQGYCTYNEKIIEIKSIGIRSTFDLEMDGDPSNFVANDLISHNSYGFNRSHAVEYSMITYWEAYCVDGSTLIWDGDKKCYTNVCKAFKEGVGKTFCYDEKSGKTKIGAIKRIIKKVLRPGKEMIFTVTTKSAKKLRVTADHKILTNKGYKKVSELKAGDLVAAEKRVNFWSSLTAAGKKIYSERFSESKRNCWKSKCSKDREKQYAGLVKYQKSGKMKAAAKKRWDATDLKTQQRIISSFIEAGANSNNGYCKRYIGYSLDGHKVFSKGELQVDNWLYAHNIVHEREVFVGRKRADFKALGLFIEYDGIGRTEEYFEQKFGDDPYLVIKGLKEIDEKLSVLLEPEQMLLGKKIIFEPIVDISPWKERDVVYDIEMEKAPYNFIARGVVVHNCKVHYPAEYMAASLSYGNKEEKNDYVQEAIRLGLQIVLPKVGVSDAYNWKAKGKQLFVPISEIKGVGEATVELIKQSIPKREGFFNTTAPIRKLNKSVVAKLEALKAYDKDCILDDKERESVRDLFSFDISNNPMGRLKGIFDLLRSKKLIKTIAEIDFTKPNHNFEWMIIRMRDLKFGYRKNVKEAKSSNTDMAGVKGNMGGAYGFIDDLTDKCMSVFSGSAYAAHKDEVEHCNGKWMLVKFNHDAVSTNIAIHDLVSADDLMIANFGVFKESENLIDRITGEFDPISDCSECALREECRSPIVCEIGGSNVLVLGEAPGKDEDRVNKAFSGASGRILWQELAERGIKRSSVCVSNVVKCFPSKTKTPSKRHIDKCYSKHLAAEIAAINPAVVLALGNTPLYALTGAEGGITNLNSTVQWIPKCNAWVVWCLHPASVLYDSSNGVAFGQALDLFADKCKKLGIV